LKELAILHKKTNAVPIDELNVNIPMFTSVIVENDDTIDHIVLWLMHKKEVPLRRGTVDSNSGKDIQQSFSIPALACHE
jgi:hypothetical protein